MATKDAHFIGVTISNYVYEYIQAEIEAGLFSSPSEWIRSACREYIEKRNRERLGGGALIHKRAVRRVFFFKKKIAGSF